MNDANGHEGGVPPERIGHQSRVAESFLPANPEDEGRDEGK